MHASAARAGLVHIMDTDSQTQNVNGSAHGDVFYYFQTSIFNKLDHKSTEKLQVKIFFLYPIHSL